MFSFFFSTTAFVLNLSMRQLNRREGDIESEAIFRSQFVLYIIRKKVRRFNEQSTQKLKKQYENFLLFSIVVILRTNTYFVYNYQCYHIH